MDNNDQNREAHGRPETRGYVPMRFEGEHEAVMWNPWNKVVQDHRDGGR